MNFFGKKKIHNCLQQRVIPTSFQILNNILVVPSIQHVTITTPTNDIFTFRHDDGDCQVLFGKFVIFRTHFCIDGCIAFFHMSYFVFKIKRVCWKHCGKEIYNFCFITLYQKDNILTENSFTIFVIL